MQVGQVSAIDRSMFYGRCLLVSLFLFAASFAQAFEIHKDFSNAHDQTLRMVLDFKTPPQVMVESVVDLKLIDRQSGKLVKFEVHEVEANMFNEDMDHLPVPVKIEEIDDGFFRISNLYFIMGGHWELKVKLGLDDHSYQIINIPMEFDSSSGICRTQP